MKDLFFALATKNARTGVQPHAPQPSKTRGCGMLPGGTCRGVVDQVADVRVASSQAEMWLA